MGKYRNKLPLMSNGIFLTDGGLETTLVFKEGCELPQFAAYYMINCAHPTHFQGALGGNGSWKHRIHAVRANASSKSHAQLDAAEELDEGNPLELGQQYKTLLAQLDNLKVLGGCCGTDHRHVEAICKAVTG